MEKNGKGIGGDDASSDIGQVAKDVANVGVSAGKAALKIAAGDAVGATVELVKSSKSIIRLVGGCCLGCVFGIILFLILILSVFLGVTTSIGGVFSNLYSGTEWSVEDNWEEYYEKLTMIYKKGYKYNRNVNERYLVQWIEDWGIKSAWSQEYSSYNDKEVVVSVSIDYNYSGMFGDSVSDDSDDDTAAIEQAVMRMLIMYQMYNALNGGDSITSEEELENITENSIWDAWDEYTEDYEGEDAEYEDNTNTPTLKGLRMILKANKENLFTATKPQLSILLPQNYSCANNGSAETLTYTTDDFNIVIVVGAPELVEPSEPEEDEYGTVYEVESYYTRSISITVTTYIKYTGEDYFASTVFGLSDEDIAACLAQTDAYALVLGKKIGGSLSETEINAILSQVEAQLRSRGDLTESQINNILRLVKSALQGVGAFTYSQEKRSLTGSGPDDFSVGTYLDCSGYLQWAFWNAGLESDASVTGSYPTSAYFRLVGSSPLSVSDLCPGDICRHSATAANGVNHVVMYIGDIDQGDGNGAVPTFVECTSPGSVITYGDNYYGNISSYAQTFRYNNF